MKPGNEAAASRRKEDERRMQKPGIALMDFHRNLIVKNLSMFCGSKREESSGKGVTPLPLLLRASIMPSAA